MTQVIQSLTRQDSSQAERASAIREAFDRDRSQMTRLLALQFGVPEVEVIRALPDQLSAELDVSRWEELIGSFASLGKVHVIVSNGAVTLECFGEFGRFSRTGDFFNVQSKSLDMHLRFQELASVFAVRKPSHLNGRETLSVQFFDRRGDAAFKVFLTFGDRSPSPERLTQYAGLVERFTLKPE